MFLKQPVDCLHMNDGLPLHQTIVNVCSKYRTEEGDNGEGRWVRQIRAYVINDQDICASLQLR